MKLYRPLLFIFLFFLFFWKGTMYLDPDFGWHLRTGQLILKSGVPKTDPFSYTMPSYHWVDHEWFSDVIIAFLYSKVSLVGLEIFFAFLSLIPLFIISYGKRYTVIPLVLGSLILFKDTGIRPQIETWIFLAILLHLLFETKNWEKWKYGIPFLFFFWANLHGGFSIGIGALFIVVVLKLFQSRKFFSSDLSVFIFALLVTFINPYGAQLWHEIWMSISDPNLHWHIEEWVPSLFSFDIGFTVLFGISIPLLFRYRKKFAAEQLALYFFFLLAALSASRNTPLFAIVAIIPLSKCFEFFEKEISKSRIMLSRFKKAYVFLLIGALLPWLFQFLANREDLAAYGQSSYPSSAVRYIDSHPIQKNLFAPYDWGGFLIWQLPQKKVFVDGRMPSWRRDMAPKGESLWAFQDFLKISTGKADIKTTFAYYSINAALLPSHNKYWNKLATELSKFGYKIKYADRAATLYEN